MAFAVHTKLMKVLCPLNTMQDLVNAIDSSNEEGANSVMLEMQEAGKR